jgi:hypothetical protein
MCIFWPTNVIRVTYFMYASNQIEQKMTTLVKMVNGF